MLQRHKRRLPGYAWAHLNFEALQVVVGPLASQHLPQGDSKGKNIHLQETRPVAVIGQPLLWRERRTSRRQTNPCKGSAFFLLNLFSLGHGRLA